MASSPPGGRGGSGVRGSRSACLLLRRLPDAAAEEMVKLLEGVGDDVLAAQRAAVPVRSGRLRQALSKDLSRATLRLRVGIVGYLANRALPHRLVVEFGQNAKVRRARRRGAGGKVVNYAIRLPQVQKRPFVFSPASLRARRVGGQRVAIFWNAAIARASEGAGNE